MGTGIPGSMRSYVSGLGAATLGLCAAGWLTLAPVAFGYRDGAPGPGRAAVHRAALPGAGLHRALLADWGTAAALAVVSLATLLAWTVAWRRQLRADGVLAGTSWREARALRRQARAQAAARAQERAAQERAAAEEQAAADAVVPADGPPDPARVLSELRALLIPLLAEPEAVPAGPGDDEPAVHEPVVHEAAIHEPAVHEAAVHEPVVHEPAVHEAVTQGPAVPLPRPGGLAAMESMLASAELLMVACGEEEAW
jgi:hypothetical protein